MSCLNKDRKRSEIVNFRVSPQERMQIDARVKALGLPKGEYFMRTFMEQPIKIMVGQYQSNRLSLELAKLSKKLSNIECNNDNKKVLEECRAFLRELMTICTTNSKDVVEEIIEIDDKLDE